LVIALGLGEGFGLGFEVLMDTIQLQPLNKGPVSVLYRKKSQILLYKIVKLGMQTGIISSGSTSLFLFQIPSISLLVNIVCLFSVTMFKPEKQSPGIWTTFVIITDYTRSNVQTTSWKHTCRGPIKEIKLWPAADRIWFFALSLEIFDCYWDSGDSDVINNMPSKGCLIVLLTMLFLDKAQMIRSAGTRNKKMQRLLNGMIQIAMTLIILWFVSSQ